MIDPIDGTANFLRGMPYWSVALAYLVDGEIEIGVTYDPVHDELFWARRGAGAYRNERAIRVSERDRSERGGAGLHLHLQDGGRGLHPADRRHPSRRRRPPPDGLDRADDVPRRGRSARGCLTMYCNSWDVIGGLLLVTRRGEPPATSWTARP